MIHILSGRRLRLRPLLGVGLCAWMILLIAHGSVYAQQPTAAPVTIQVNGAAASGTRGLTLPAGYPITLRLLRDGVPVTETGILSAVNADGSFQFVDVAAMTGDLLLVTMEFEGVPQGSALVAVSADQTSYTLPLTVYGVTSDPAAVTLSSAQYVIDLKKDFLQVLATLYFTNATDRLYFSPERTTGGQPVSVTVPLPVGSFGIAFDDKVRYQVGGEQFAPIVQDTRAVIPGQGHEVILSFQVPFKNGAILDQDMPYVTQAVKLLIPDDTKLILTTPDDHPAFGGSPNTALNPKRPYTEYALSAPIAAGGRLIYTLEQSQKSAPPPLAVSSDSPIGAGAYVLAALAAFGIVVLGVILLRGLSQKRKV